jgi:hypothetical protein
MVKSLPNLMYPPPTQKYALFCFRCILFSHNYLHRKSKGQRREQAYNLAFINPCIQDHENSLGHLSAFLGWKDLERCLNYGGRLTTNSNEVATAAT